MLLKVLLSPDAIDRLWLLSKALVLPSLRAECLIWDSISISIFALHKPNFQLGQSPARQTLTA